MKYSAFRIDTTSIKDHKVVHGYFIRGQRTTDYNWPLLAEADSLEQAKNVIRLLMTDPVRQVVYGPNGYGIQL